MSNAMIVNAAPVARAIAPARVVAGRRLPAAAPVASSRKLSIVSTAVMGRSGSSRTVVAAAFNFKNPFGGNSDEEEDAEEEAGGDSDTVEGNPFLSKSSVDEDSSSSSAPELPNFPKLPGNPFASFGAKEDDEEDEEEYEEEFEAPTKSGNPFGNPFASFGGMNQTIDQTVDLDYEDEDEEEPSKGGFGGFALPSFPKKDPPSAPPAQKKKEPEREKKTLGNWERTIREGLKDSDVPIWTLDPEPVRGASLRPVKLRAGDFLVVGRDKGPGVDYVAKVNCVSGVHCQFEMDGQKLFVTDLGSTNGTYVSGREVRKNVRSRVYNGDSVRLGAENVNGEAFVTFDTDLTGAKELDKNTEYGQLQALIEAVGGVNVVVNFLIVNVFFQLGFYFLLQLQTN